LNFTAQIIYHIISI